MPAEADMIHARNQRAYEALVALHAYILDEEEEDPSGADQCAMLYEVLESFGLKVP